MSKELLTISLSPHIKGEETTPQIMYGVAIALLPALIVSIIFFGLGAIKVTLFAVAFCLLFEFLIQKFIMKVESSIGDGSALITGLLLAFNLPSNFPIWMLLIGALAAMAIGKLSFGGLGNNPFNPALVGRVFLLICFPVQMTSWPLPKLFSFSSLDSVTGATALGVAKEAIKQGQSIAHIKTLIPGNLDLFLGQAGGSLGEVSALALILGGLYMLYKKIITWHIPVSFIGTVIIFTGILWAINCEQYMSPLFHLLTGGLMLGAIFMATDMVTSPMTKKGQLIFGVGCGLLTVIIRIFGAYPEGVSFAILLMNAVVPLINILSKPKPFGTN
ncbi:MAG: RnfABCDGE type electron transport complex subunit D [Bacteriovoracaceae bacterium]|nr:RnfABCDGE type electron transport complex subunit D [Bacteriovoracaceae bacterium]